MMALLADLESEEVTLHQERMELEECPEHLVSWVDEVRTSPREAQESQECLVETEIKDSLDHLDLMERGVLALLELLEGPEREGYQDVLGSRDPEEHLERTERRRLPEIRDCPVIKD